MAVIDELAKKRIDEFQHLRESKSSESSIHEKDLEQFQTAYKSQGTELNSMQSIMSDMNK